METARTVTSRVFTISAVEGRDEWDEKYDRCYGVLQSLIADLSEKEAHDALTSAVCKDAKTHEDVSIGLLYVILTEPQNATRSYRDLTFVSRDGLSLVLNHVTQVVSEKFQRLQDPVRIQLLWLLKELVRANVTNTDLLAWTILRQVAGGDVSPRNLWLAENLLDLFADQRLWLDKYPFLVASVVYTYLRLMEDHMSPLLAGLRQKETTLCVSLLREKFADCIAIGRDLVRLLQNVSRIPEIEALWRDILFNPRSLCPTFTGVLQLLQMRTSRRFLVSRLTPDMEKKMFFLTSNVRFGNQKRYQDWFQKQYLSTPESQSLRCDLIRFIVGVIHPSNEVLCSDIIPRWAVLGWLLTTCTHPVAQANAKLALFYDWLFYDAERDNIMNIEPAILVMYHSIRAHPAITATLLDFLCRIIPSFYPPLTAQVRQGVGTSFRQILEKRVLPSLQPLLENPKLDRELRSLVNDSFPEFCTSTPGNPLLSDGIKTEDMKEEDTDTASLGINSEPGNAVHQPEPAFSDDDDDDDTPLSKYQTKDKMLEHGGPDAAQLPDLSAYLDEFRGNIRLHIEQLYTETDNEVRCLALENFVQTISQDPVEGEQLTALGNCLSAIFSQDLTIPILPEVLNNENLEDSISRPLFVLLRCFAEMVDDDSNGKSALLDVLLELYTKYPRLGYLLLYYLKASKADENKYAAYEELCQARDKEIDECLAEDLALCSEDDISLLCYLTPDVYSKFPEYCRNKGPLLRVIVSCIDGSQLFQLTAHVLQGNLTIFQKDSSLLPFLTSSLEWETFEQMALWQLLSVHSLPLTALLPLIPKLKEPDHSEALSALMMMIKDEKPTSEILKPLLNSSLETFTSVLLSHWSTDSSTANSLSNVIASQFNSSLNLNGSNSLTGSQSSPGKRKRTTMNSLSASTTFKTAPTPGAGVDSTVETMLKHVEMLRSTLAAIQVPKGKQPAEMKVFAQDSLQQALQNVQQICNDMQKKKYSDLFSLLESNDEPEVNSRRGGGRGVKRTAQRAAQSSRGRVSLKEESEEESSEEEVIVKQRPTKKRRKANLVGSDSD